MNGMDQTEEAMVARALEIEPALLPYVPELLADFDALGSDVERIIQLLRVLALPAGAHMIDLGSDKGALAIELAKQLPCEALGIDLFAPFMQSSVLLAFARTGKRG